MKIEAAVLIQAPPWGYMDKDEEAAHVDRAGTDLCRQLAHTLLHHFKPIKQLEYGTRKPVLRFCLEICDPEEAAHLRNSLRLARVRAVMAEKRLIVVDDFGNEVQT